LPKRRAYSCDAARVEIDALRRRLRFGRHAHLDLAKRLQIARRALQREHAVRAPAGLGRMSDQLKPCTGCSRVE
jgi:hypothetical protein